MRKHTLAGSIGLHIGSLLLGFLLGAAAHQARHKAPAVIRFEPASQKLGRGRKSMVTYPNRVV